MMSRRLAPKARARSDLAGTFRDAGQHDIHDADATDQQRDSRDTT